MTRVHSYATAHSYTSLRDVVACSLVAASNNQWSTNQCKSPGQSFSDVQHVHMRNPLLEKAARAYLATASSRTERDRNVSNGTTTGFSSFLKIVGFPFYSLFGGASAWFKQLYINKI